MQVYENLAQPKFKSQIEIIDLHAKLNNELERFHQCIDEIRKHTHLEKEHLEKEKMLIIQTIHGINKKIQSIITAHKRNN